MEKEREVYRGSRLASDDPWRMRRIRSSRFGFNTL